jgi:outer membrane usher protein
MSGGSPKQTVEDDGTVTTQYDTVYNLRMSRKAKNQLLLSQPMGQYGSLSLSWDQQTYWNTSNTTQSLQFAWNATFRNVSLGVSVQRRSSSLYDDKKDNILSMSISVPLGNPTLSTRARFTTTHADSTAATSTGVSGYLPGRRICSIASTSATAPDSTTARCHPAVRRRVGRLQPGLQLRQRLPQPQLRHQRRRGSA